MYCQKISNFTAKSMPMSQRLSGGTRLHETSGPYHPELPVVSVITVVFNGASTLEPTVRSVIEQSYPNIEYIIIDGGSTDGTLDIIQRHENHVAFWISEPDQGIYDAMNKGLDTATGDYVWFMNAGDRIYTPETLSLLFNPSLSSLNLDPPGHHPPPAVILYGDTMIVDPSFREIGLRRLRPPEQLNWKSFRKGMLVCHQSIIVHRSLAESYNLRYRHSADFDWVIRALKKSWKQQSQVIEPNQPTNSAPIINTRQILCAFLDGGHSKQNIPASLRERFDIMRRHYGLPGTVIRHLPIAMKFFSFWLRKGRF
ncbi:MAG: glycosyltransferase family 2 protein [Clostridia bacterium]|nr:glycosyltransferase family 2 protein [Clostridia bacterium]